jgi:hypothetical protein
MHSRRSNQPATQQQLLPAALKICMLLQQSFVRHFSRQLSLGTFYFPSSFSAHSFWKLCGDDDDDDGCF